MYKTIKQRVSMSVLDLVLALDPVCSKIMSVVNDRRNILMHLWIDWHISTRNKQWNDHSRQRNDAEFDPKYVAFLQIFRFLRECGKRPDISVDVYSEHAQQD
jgi:hypothetical protein